MSSRAGQRPRRDPSPAELDRGARPDHAGSARDGAHEPPGAHRIALRAASGSASGRGGRAPGWPGKLGHARSGAAARRPDRPGRDRPVRCALAASGLARRVDGASEAGGLHCGECRSTRPVRRAQRPVDPPLAETRRADADGGAVARRRARPQGRGGAGHGHDRRPGAADRPTARQLARRPAAGRGSRGCRDGHHPCRQARGPVRGHGPGRLAGAGERAYRRRHDRRLDPGQQGAGTGRADGRRLAHGEQWARELGAAA